MGDTTDRGQASTGRHTCAESAHRQPENQPAASDINHPTNRSLTVRPV